METLSEVLPIVIYFLLIVLLVVAIVMGIKLLSTISKIDTLVDDVNNKMKVIDKIFNTFDLVTNKFSFITDSVVTGVKNLIKKIFSKKESEEEDE